MAGDRRLNLSERMELGEKLHREDRRQARESHRELRVNWQYLVALALSLVIFFGWLVLFGDLTAQ